MKKRTQEDSDNRPRSVWMGSTIGSKTELVAARWIEELEERVKALETLEPVGPELAKAIVGVLHPGSKNPHGGSK